MTPVEIGRVIKPHGIRGEVGVLLHRPESDILEQLTEVTLVLTSRDSRIAALEHVSRMGQGYRVKFAGCHDRTAAELLRGATLWVSRNDLPELDDNEDYLVDLLGASVVDMDGAPFGTVSEVLTYPSVDSIVIERVDGSRVEQPLVEQWVEIRRAEGKLAIVLRNLEGLL